MKHLTLRLMVCAAMVSAIILAMAACAAQQSGRPAGAAGGQDKVIAQVKQGAITIDGDLQEWPARGWIPVDKNVYGGSATPSADLDVKAAFAFDAEKFYLAVRATDDDIQKVDRSWRYGDGFMFTLVTDEGKDVSSYVHQYAFDQETKALLFKNGEYLLDPAEALAFEFRPRKDGLDYEVAIPLELLRPFSPFSYEEVALNLAYADKDSGASATTVMIHPDANYDTERSAMRAGEFFALKTATPRTAQDASYHAALAKNFFRNGERIDVRYAVNAARKQGNVQVSAAMTGEGAAAQPVEATLDLQPGLNRGTLALPTGDLPTGNYTLRVSFEDPNGNGVFAHEDSVFVMNQREVAEAKNAVSGFKGQEALRPSLSNLEIRYDWLDEFYQRTRYEDISALQGWWDDIRALTSRLEQGEPAVFGTNTIKRYAHRSKIDDTLQPYSVFLPENFDPRKQYPLVVSLHGSGVDEQTEIQGYAQAAGMLGYPLIAPKARGLSDYYIGKSGDDVFECIEHFLTLYPNIRRDRIILLGFSMGGYGAWRLGELRPDFFRGLVVVSGDVRPDVLQGVGALRDQNIFVIQGAADNAVSVSGARQMVEKLKALNANVTYIEIPEGGHGGNWNDDLVAKLLAWIKQYGD
jgi:pimeloyl-ACP methyl ester carboxylesterase